jgi:hypothetical protein
MACKSITAEATWQQQQEQQRRQQPLEVSK